MRVYHDRFYYLLMDETDVVTGKTFEKRSRKAVAEICEGLEKKPSVVMICITCVDATAARIWSVSVIRQRSLLEFQ
ncbi:MAG: hypothetical protein ACLVAT_13680 [Lachnospiraceae bacterium]